MPFTFSHPAILLPLYKVSRKYISMTGLIIGSITPDFEYFIRMRVKSVYSHTLPGLLFFNLPVGILLAFMFHNLVRNNLIKNLPGFLQLRFYQFQQFDWNERFVNKWLVISLSIITGAASHLLWDSFTHEHGYFVNLIPSLRETIEIAGNQLPAFKILQHGSSFVGSLAIIYAIYMLPSPLLSPRKISFLYWLTIAVLTLLIASLRCYAFLHYFEYGNIIVTFIGALLISLTIASLVLYKMPAS